MTKRRKKSSTATIIFITILVIAYAFSNFKDKKTAPAVSGTVELHIIDVGQGDSVLIKTELGNMLIDAGTNDSEKQLSEYLDMVGVTDFEYCIFTHPHEDHIGGADMIIDNYDVRNVIISPAVTTTNTFERLIDALECSEAKVIEAAPDDKYFLGDLEIFIMGPIIVGDQRDLNNSSVITRLSFGDVRMMFTGDAEKEQENDVLFRYPKSELVCDFLKMGHHGSSTSSSASFIEAVDPYLAAISCGKNNSYGHPHREIVKLLSDRNIEYHRTDTEGDIVYICDGKTIKIKE